MTLYLHPNIFVRRMLPRLVLFILGIGYWSLPAMGQQRSALQDGKVVDFQRDIVPIFQKHCLECHNEEDAKNDFRIDDPESVFTYVEAEDWESSSLYVDYLLSEDPDYLMPPPKQGGPLSPAELSLIRVWIQEGADWPEGATMVPPGESSEGETAEKVESAEEVPGSLVQRVWRFQGFFHPATVHFPIALFLLGAFFVVVGFKWPELGRQIPLACLLLGTLTSVAATSMGWSFASEEGYGSWTKVDFDSEVFWHRWSGVIVTVSALICSLFALRSLGGPNPKVDRIWKTGLVVVALMVGLVGHQGGELSYGHDFYPRAFRILFGTSEVMETDAIESSGEDDVALKPSDDSNSVH